MKQMPIYLLLGAAVAFTSCSKDDKQSPFTPSITFDVNELLLEPSKENDGAFKGKLVVTSNVDWTVDKAEAPFVGEITPASNPVENQKQVENIIWVSADPAKLTIGEQSGVLHFKDAATDLDVPLKVKFTGAGNSYINFERGKIMDMVFDAKGTNDMTGDPIPGAVVSVDFDVLAVNPVDFIVIRYDNNLPMHQEIWWAGVEAVSPLSGTGLRSGTYRLWVQDRYHGTGSDQERMALLFVVPSGTTIDDLFDGDTDNLKTEWEGKGARFKQKALINGQ